MVKFILRVANLLIQRICRHFTTAGRRRRSGIERLTNPLTQFSLINKLRLNLVNLLKAKELLQQIRDGDVSSNGIVEALLETEPNGTLHHRVRASFVHRQWLHANRGPSEKVLDHLQRQEKWMEFY